MPGPHARAGTLNLSVTQALAVAWMFEEALECRATVSRSNLMHKTVFPGGGSQGIRGTRTPPAPDRFTVTEPGGGVKWRGGKGG